MRVLEEVLDLLGVEAGDWMQPHCPLHAFRLQVFQLFEKVNAHSKLEFGVFFVEFEALCLGNQVVLDVKLLQWALQIRKIVKNMFDTRFSQEIEPQAEDPELALRIFG